ncbi:extracellular solute-binding protein [Streptomyces sp. NPDC056519]|uniref:extracellular solute-binding protein n=1 Tax=Streptomyces sp. NPDC056519 TaxID=3345849 RepID=UPI0036C8746C
MVNLDVTWVAEFAAAGLVQPLPDRLVDDDDVKSVAGTARWGEKLYSVPFNSDVGLLFYRRDHLTSAGVTNPDLGVHPAGRRPLRRGGRAHRLRRRPPRLRARHPAARPGARGPAAAHPALRCLQPDVRRPAGPAPGRRTALRRPAGRRPRQRAETGPSLTPTPSQRVTPRGVTPPGRARPRGACRGTGPRR